MRDWWQKRELDRELAVELGSAYEKFRLVSFRVNELAGILPMRAPPDSSARLQEATAARALAYAEYVSLLERWKHFVIHGTLPEESEPPCDSRSRERGAG
jgi:hypothetical protein